MKRSISRKPEKEAQAKKERLDGLKTRKGGPCKSQRHKKNENMKNDYPDRLKPTRVVYAKVKDHDKVTASGRT